MAARGPHPDMDRLQRLLGPEYIHIDQDGPEPRAEVLREIEKLRGLSFQYNNPHAVMVSPTGGYVVADVHYSWPFNGSLDKEHKRTTTVLALREGRWVATLHTELSILNGGLGNKAVPQAAPYCGSLVVSDGLLSGRRGGGPAWHGELPWAKWTQ